MTIYCYAEHTTRGGEVYTGDDTDWASQSDDVIEVTGDSREDLITTAAEWASRSGPENQHTIACGRAILDHLGVIDESHAAEIIEDIGLEIGTAEMAWCRIALELTDGDGTLSPQDMMWMSSDPRRHTYTSMREALLMLGCVEQEEAR